MVYLFFSAVRPNQEKALLSGAGMKAVASRLAEELAEKVSVVEVDEADANIINYVLLGHWCAVRSGAAQVHLMQGHSGRFRVQPTPKWPSLTLFLMEKSEKMFAPS